MTKEKGDLDVLLRELNLEINRESIAAQGEPAEILQLKSKLEDKAKAIERFRTQATNLQHEKFIPRVTLNSPATTPGSLDYSRFTKLGGSASIAVFFIIVGAVSLLEFLSYKVSDTSQVVKSMGLPILGMVPAAPKRMRRNPAQAPSERNWFGSTRSMKRSTAFAPS